MILFKFNDLNYEVRYLKRIEKSSYIYCLNGLLSGGIGYLIPIYIYYVFGEELAGITSVLVSYAAITLLLPRGLGQLYLSKMGEVSNNQEKIVQSYDCFFRNNIIAILIVSLSFPFI
ncbi:hypothetical protein, partial [Vibrio splendidus]|uniref:hypothetical protein n=1 Tax=Vibrio splendidus TaxID=29497 RepID=UPI001A7E0AA8